MAVSKVVYGGRTLIDLTGDTVESSKLLVGITAHGKDGEQITGTCDFDSNTMDATAAASEVLLTGIQSDGNVLFQEVNSKFLTNSSWKNATNLLYRTDLTKAFLSYRCDLGSNEFFYYSIGLCDDGTVLFAGDNNDGNLSISNWNNIMVPIQ